MLVVHIQARGLPLPEFEMRFHRVRKWRFDMAWPKVWSVDGVRPPVVGVAVEVDGGVWKGGRHVRGGGYEKDCEKLNEAVVLGWRVLRFTPGMIESGMAIGQLEKVLRG